MLDNLLALSLTDWKTPIFEETRLSVRLLRLDLLHPDFGGNKFFKLKYNLVEMRRQGKDTLVTFGGAFSNHIWATAAVGHHLGLRTVGYIRGEETLPLNEVLQQASDWGMTLQYVSRADYRSLKTGEIPCLPNEYVVPEGGSNVWAVQGCSEILRATGEICQADFVAVPCGTGATLAGLIASGISTNFLGFSVLKGGDFLRDEVQNLLLAYRYTPHAGQTWDIITEYHAGGYAKISLALLDFARDFSQKYFVLDEVYTAKMLWGIEERAKQGFFPTGSKIWALITQRQLAKNGRLDNY